MPPIRSVLRLAVLVSYLLATTGGGLIQQACAASGLLEADYPCAVHECACSSREACLAGCCCFPGAPPETPEMPEAPVPPQTYGTTLLSSACRGAAGDTASPPAPAVPHLVPAPAGGPVPFPGLVRPGAPVPVLVSFPPETLEPVPRPHLVRA